MLFSYALFCKTNNNDSEYDSKIGCDKLFITISKSYC